MVQHETMAMAYWGLLFLILSILIHLVRLTVAQQPTFVARACSYLRGNYANKCMYEANLNGILASFSNTTVDYGFYNSSAGEVNAIALCRGDLMPDACRSCFYTSSNELKGAFSQLQGSYYLLRYLYVTLLLTTAPYLASMNVYQLLFR